MQNLHIRASHYADLHSQTGGTWASVAAREQHSSQQS